MLKDDRMMSMLTFVVIMIAVGTLIQRVDVLERYFGGESVALELRRDEAIVRANALSAIDVLANDLGLKDGDAGKLIIAQQPRCGRVFVRDAQVQYLPAERCAGSQSFQYAISGRGQAQTGEVIVVVRLGDPTQAEVAADAQRDIPAPSPMVPRATEQQVGATPGLLAAQPSTGVDPSGAAIHAPAVPQPQAPAIGGLPDTAPGAGSTAAANGGSATARVTLDGSGAAPSMTAPAGEMAAAPPTAVAPVVPRPGPDAFSAGAPDAEAPSQNATSQNATSQNVTSPEAPALPATVLAGTRRLTEPLQPGVLPRDGTAGADTSSGAATLALARVDPAPLAGGEPAAPSVQREIEGLDANVPRASPPEIGSGDSGETGLGQPADVLAAVRALGQSAELAPVDTTAPATLPDPNATGPDAAAGTAAQPDASADRVAALPPPTVPCTVPPALTLDVKPAGLTEVVIESPCRAGTVAELAYDGLRLGLALDAAGVGAVAAVGLQQASDATLRFADGETVSFNIPFADSERLDRVALAWETPVDLELHAFEFGALPQGDGHVGPGRARSFADVRRRGGGYLLEYRPIGGVGQSVQVYTFWRRQGGRTGVVKLSVDFASRDGRKRPDTCSGGALSEPGFTVLRSSAGRLERPRLGRLASLDCAAVAGGNAGAAAGSADRFIGDAVDDLIVLQR